MSDKLYFFFFRPLTFEDVIDVIDLRQQKVISSFGGQTAIMRSQIWQKQVADHQQDTGWPGPCRDGLFEQALKIWIFHSHQDKLLPMKKKPVLAARKIGSQSSFVLHVCLQIETCAVNRRKQRRPSLLYGNTAVKASQTIDS